MSHQSVNPYNGKLLKKIEELTDQQLEAALKTATTCYETWKRKTYAERAVIAAKAAAIMHFRVDEFARLVTLEMSKLVNGARGEVKFSADMQAFRFSLAPDCIPILQCKTHERSTITTAF